MRMGPPYGGSYPRILEIDIARLERHTRHLVMRYSRAKHLSVLDEEADIYTVDTPIPVEYIRNVWSPEGLVSPQSTPEAITNPKSREEWFMDWAKLINMKNKELEAFLNSPLGKKAGLSASEAKEQGIHSGRVSGRAILRMRKKIGLGGPKDYIKGPKHMKEKLALAQKKWNDNDWEWCARQVRFNKRFMGDWMGKRKGPLVRKGQPTRRLLALWVWGFDPWRYARKVEKRKTMPKCPKVPWIGRTEKRMYGVQSDEVKMNPPSQSIRLKDVISRQDMKALISNISARMEGKRSLPGHFIKTPGLTMEEKHKRNKKIYAKFLKDHYGYTGNSPINALEAVFASQLKKFKKDKLTIYRAIITVNDPEALSETWNKYGVFESWGTKKHNADIYSAGGSVVKLMNAGNQALIEGEIYFGDVDWAHTVRNNIAFGKSEDEINPDADTTVFVKKVSFYKLDDKARKKYADAVTGIGFNWKPWIDPSFKPVNVWEPKEHFPVYGPDFNDLYGPAKANPQDKLPWLPEPAVDPATIEPHLDWPQFTKPAWLPKSMIPKTAVFSPSRATTIRGVRMVKPAFYYIPPADLNALINSQKYLELQEADRQRKIAEAEALKKQLQEQGQTFVGDWKENPPYIFKQGDIIYYNNDTPKKWQGRKGRRDTLIEKYDSFKIVRVWNVGNGKEFYYQLAPIKAFNVVKEIRLSQKFVEENFIKEPDMGSSMLPDYLVNPRIPKKYEGQDPSEHSDLYTDEDPKGTIQGLGFKDKTTAERSINIIKRSGKTHAHKIQAAMAMEQRARFHPHQTTGIKQAQKVYARFIEEMKKKTKAMRNPSAGYQVLDREKDEADTVYFSPDMDPCCQASKEAYLAKFTREGDEENYDSMVDIAMSMDCDEWRLYLEGTATDSLIGDKAQQVLDEWDECAEEQIGMLGLDNPPNIPFPIPEEYQEELERRLTEEMTSEGYKPHTIPEVIEEGLYDDSPSDFAYAQGEYEEFLEEIEKGDFDEAYAEYSDVEGHVAYWLWTNHRIQVPIYTGTHVDKTRVRIQIFNHLFNQYGLKFGPKYLKGGSNYEKVHKVRMALDAAADDQGKPRSKDTDEEMAKKVATSVAAIVKKNPPTVIATGAPHKIAEYEKHLGDGYSFNDTYDLPEVEAGPKTVAIHKAKLAYEVMGGPVLVEDTTLHIRGMSSKDASKIKWLVKNLDKHIGKRAIERVYIGYCDGEKVYLYLGQTKGTLLSPRGDKGFGYDLYFSPDGSDKTYAEEKFVSSRTKAIKKMLSDKPDYVGPMPADWKGEWQAGYSPADGINENPPNSLEEDFEWMIDNAYENLTKKIQGEDPDYNGQMWWNEQKPWIREKYGMAPVEGARWLTPIYEEDFDPDSTEGEFTETDDATPLHFLNQLKRIPLQREPNALRILQVALNIGQGLAVDAIEERYSIEDFVAYDNPRTPGGKKFPSKYLKGLNSLEKMIAEDEIDKGYKYDADDPKAYEFWKSDIKATARGLKIGTSKHRVKYYKKYRKNIDKDYKPAGNSPKQKFLNRIRKETKIKKSILEKIYDKGLAAWRVGHRPGVQQHQWAAGRVYAFAVGADSSTGPGKPDHKLAVEAGVR